MTEAAVRGRPTLVMVEPILEIAWPPQSLRKSRSRVRPPGSILTVLHGGVRRFHRTATVTVLEVAMPPMETATAADPGDNVAGIFTSICNTPMGSSGAAPA